MGNILKGGLIAALGYGIARSVEAGVTALYNKVRTSAEESDKDSKESGSKNTKSKSTKK